MQKNIQPFWLHHVHPLFKLLFALLAAIIVFFSLISKIDLLARLMISWDAFTVTSLWIYWIIFFNTSTKQIRAKAKDEDSGGAVVLFVSLVASLVSLLAVIILLTSKEDSSKLVHIIPALSGLFLSWGMVHTLFTARYAHLYYSDDKKDNSKFAGGLDFPDDDDPDYLDFAYYSFVIGMTFQVSDVDTTSKKLRQLTLVHSLISFAFNTIIVALTINVIAGLGE